MSSCFVTPWIAVRWAPLSIGLSRQEYLDEWLLPSPGTLPEPGIKPRSPALQADSLPLSHQGSPYYMLRAFYRKHQYPQLDSSSIIFLYAFNYVYISTIHPPIYLIFIHSSISCINLYTFPYHFSMYVIN